MAPSQTAEALAAASRVARQVAAAVSAASSSAYASATAAQYSTKMRAAGQSKRTHSGAAVTAPLAL
jgi:hypothetical protein